VINLKKILISMFSIGAVAIVAVFATQAFFSDTETSTGNRFVAGDIDLQIDNESYAIDWNIPNYFEPTGDFVATDHTSWTLRDLTVERFFDFVDLKPGDYGEDTISVHVGSNDAWVCAAAQITADHDNTYTEPELAVDQTIGVDPLLTDGELDEEVNFAFWWDDGDNVYEVGEQIFLEGPISGMGDAGQIALADFNTGNPFPGGSTRYIGKYWCFGDMTSTDVAQDGLTTSGPLGGRGTGFTCDGSDVNNASQTDVVKANLQFYAVQHRHNEEFLCSDWTPVWPEGDNAQRLVLENKNPEDFDEVYYQDGRYGVLTWAGDGSTFDFSGTFVGYDLNPDTKYALIYYADPWPGNNPGAFLGAGTTDANGDVEITGNVDLGHDLPHPTDANSADGAKIWLVLMDDYNDGTESTGPMTAWNPSQYLFETVLIHYDDTEN
jgi:predicted ribosomally synthesized peptide with SipW-like signal peptide